MKVGRAFRWTFLLAGLYLCVFGQATLGSRPISEETLVEDMGALQSDFGVTAEIVGANSTDRGVVDGVTTFRIDDADTVVNTARYDLFYFLDGKLQHLVRGISLPYDFKQTYRGQTNGAYEVTFALRDDSGQTGVTSLSLRVRHRVRKQSEERSIGTR